MGTGFGTHTIPPLSEDPGGHESVTPVGPSPPPIAASPAATPLSLEHASEELEHEPTPAELPSLAEDALPSPLPSPLPPSPPPPPLPNAIWKNVPLGRVRMGTMRLLSTNIIKTAASAITSSRRAWSAGRFTLCAVFFRVFFICALLSPAAETDVCVRILGQVDRIRRLPGTRIVNRYDDMVIYPT